MNIPITPTTDPALAFPDATPKQLRLWREWGCPADVPPDLIPDPDELITEDDQAVDNLFTEKQQRLLAESLYSSWPGPGEGRTFKALANVGLIYKWKTPAIVPDVMLSLDVEVSVDLTQKENRSYVFWVVGKMPELVMEIVSNLQGGERTIKMRDYARLGIPHYVVFDPFELLEGEVLEAFGLTVGVYQPIPCQWIAAVGLGLLLWEGIYEGQQARWLRWCDAQGKVILTGRERAEQERQRAEQEHKSAEQERQRAELAETRVRQLEEKLRSQGIDPGI